MGKKPYIEFYTGDYLRDPNLGMCSPLARGVWMDALCAMHEAGGTGQLRGTYEQFSRILRASVEEVKHAFTEIRATNTADIQEHGNGLVTLINRRMNRLYNERENIRSRVEKCRSNVNVTEENKNCNMEKTEPVTEDVTARKPESNKPSFPPLASPSLSPASSSSSSSSSDVKDISERKNEYKKEVAQERPAVTPIRLPPLSDFQTSYAAGKPIGKAQDKVPAKQSQAESSTSSGGKKEPSNGRPGGGTPGKLERVWVASGKSVVEYMRLTKTLPALTVDEEDCLGLADVEITKSMHWYCRRAKALIGEGKFSQVCHEVKQLKIEGKKARVNDTARFLAYLEKAVKECKA